MILALAMLAQVWADLPPAPITAPPPPWRWVERWEDWYRPGKQRKQRR